MRDQAGFVVELEKFSGPLDLLLHLIREDEVDITDLPIAKIADQFLSIINELGLNQAADYLEMAARLPKPPTVRHLDSGHVPAVTMPAAFASEIVAATG